MNQHPPGEAPPVNWIAGMFQQMGFPIPAEAVAMVQQLNHNLEMLQGPQLLEQLERLNTNLENMAPGLALMTESLNSFQQRMWGQG